MAAIWRQALLELRPRSRGVHSVTREVLAASPSLADIRVGFLHLFLRHTSASLTVNEDADPDVRPDLAMALDRVAPEDWPYRHRDEGPDDMPAHVKATLVGVGLLLPVGGGKLLLGAWQGIHLGEHRDRAGSRSLVLTAFGDG